MTDFDDDDDADQPTNQLPSEYFRTATLFPGARGKSHGGTVKWYRR
jgi:hypothetical protein